MSTDQPLHLGACLVDGRLYATVMRREPNDCITVVATAEIDESMLRAHDCHAVMRPAKPVAWQARKLKDGKDWGPPGTDRKTFEKLAAEGYEVRGLRP